MPEKELAPNWSADKCPACGGTGISLRSYELSPGPLVATPPTPAKCAACDGTGWKKLDTSL
jgi:hypothetical protein